MCIGLGIDVCEISRMEKRLLDEDGQGTLGNRWNMFDKVCGTNKIRIEFSKNYKVADIIDYWNKDVDAFKEKSKK